MKTHNANAAPATVIELKIYPMSLFLREWEDVDSGIFPTHKPGDLPETSQEIN